MRLGSSARVAAALVLLGAARLALADPGAGAITGVITDGATGRPLVGVVVEATGPAAPAGRTGLTDARGAFTLGDLPPGQYRLSASLEGYLPEARADLTLGALVTLRASLALTPEAVSLEEVVVTGSHVKRKDLTTPAPVTIVTREQFAESGKATIGEYLQTLPELSGGLNRQFNNGGDGSTRADLRGLGAYRTLVLVNGRRFVSGGIGGDESVDLGTIPSAAVARVEVLKDGASPIYGSEAIGGVINVITLKRWSGTEATAWTGTSSRGDGTGYSASLTTGQASEAGSLLFALGFGQEGAIGAGDRTYSNGALNYDATGWYSPLGTVGPYHVGSSNIPGGRIVIGDAAGVVVPNPDGSPKIDLYNQLVTRYPAARQFVRDPTAPLGWAPSDGKKAATLPLDGGDAYNFQPDNYLVTPSRRLSLFMTGDLALGRSSRAFFEATFSGRSSQSKLAPDPLYTASTETVVSADNLYNPFGVDLYDVRRRLVELSNRTYTQRVAALRVVGGLGGTLPEGFGPLEGWSWEASVNYGQSEATETRVGYLRLNKLQQALGPSFNEGTAANPVMRCGEAGAAIEGCVPLDLFGGPGSITPEQYAGLTYTGVGRGDNRITMFQAAVTGDLFRLAADRPVALAAGYEHRETSGSLVPDPVSAGGDTDTDPATSIQGSQQADEGYLELSIPVASRRPLLEALEVQAAARVFRYSGFDTDWTWKLGARWTPIRSVTLRGTLSTAYRAPSVVETGLAIDNVKDVIHDPCSGLDPAGNPAPISPHCPAGPTPPFESYYQPSTRGNPALQPERAKVFTLGVVLEPTFAKGLSVTLDAWGVAISAAPQWPSDGWLLEQCYPVQTGPVPPFCAGMIGRNPADNTIAYIKKMPINVGAEEMTGVDLGAGYRLETPAGAFGLSFLGTWLRRYDQTQWDGKVIHGRGTYDLGAHPALKFNAGLTWGLGGLGAGLDVHYVGSFKQCGSPDPLEANGSPVYDENGDQVLGGHFDQFEINQCATDAKYSLRVPDYATWGGFVSYAMKSAAGRTEVALGAQNLLDARPPTIYGLGAYTSDPSAYDYTGRSFYLRVTHRL